VPPSVSWCHRAKTVCGSAPGSSATCTNRFQEAGPVTRILGMTRSCPGSAGRGAVYQQLGFRDVGGYLEHAVS
jgi:hypothetical protein